MALPWIKMYVGVEQRGGRRVNLDIDASDKLGTFAELLGIDENEAIGLLFHLWAGLVRQDWRDGRMLGATPTMIRRICKWRGDADTLVRALLDCGGVRTDGSRRAGFIELDEDGTYRAHDWADFTGADLSARQADSDRHRRSQQAAKKSATARPQSQPMVQVATGPVPDDPYLNAAAEAGKADARRARRMRTLIGREQAAGDMLSGDTPGSP